MVNIYLNPIYWGSRERVMRRIRFIFLVRKFFRPIIAESFVLLGALSTCVFLVSLKDIMANMSSMSFRDSVDYLWESAFRSDFFTQMILGVICIAGLLFMKDCVRKLVQYLGTFGRQAKIS